MHISLDQALGRESSSPSRVGDRLLQKTGGAAMAFSLRALTGNGGNALRIRRSSDNVEVNVGFDGSGVVSTTSPITNVTEPTALSLGSSWAIATGSASSTTLSPLSSLSVSGASSGFQVRVAITNPTIPSGSIVNVSTFVSSITGSWSIYLADAGGGAVSNIATMANSVSLTTINANAAYIYIRSNNAAGAIQLAFGFGASYTVGDTTSTNLGDFISGTDAYVVTWYDQSGNGNDFTNPITSTQPKIASSGSYLGYIDFDSDLKKLENTSISGIPAGDHSFHIVQAQSSLPEAGFLLTFYNSTFTHYTYYQGTNLVSGFSVGSGIGSSITIGEFNQFSVLGSLSPNQQITTRNTLAYSSGGGVSADPPALTFAQFGDGTTFFANSLFKIKEFVFLNTVDSDIVSEVSSGQTTYFGTPD